MKTHKIISFLVITLMFISCNSNINQPDIPLLYNGIVVSESVPDFNQNSSLSKSNSANAKIEQEPPYGTVYGHESDPDNVYLSYGGETLPQGAWADQVYQETYKTILFGNTSGSFSSLSTVTILSPVDCYYLDSSGNWIEVSSDVTVQTTSVRTSSNGTCVIQSNNKCDIGEGGGVG